MPPHRDDNARRDSDLRTPCGSRSVASRFPALLLGLCVAAGCAPKTPAAAPSSSDDESGQPSPAEATAPSQERAEEPPRADVLYEASPAVPAASAECPTAGTLPPTTTCDSPQQELASALSLTGAERDDALSKLEACKSFDPGSIRALRAELAPRCADRLVAPLVGQEAKAELPPDLRHQLVGLGLGARLRRTAHDPPPPPESLERAPLEAYLARTLFPWISEQAKAIYAMAAQGAQLSGYARGIVAIEAGMADMRFVEIARAVPIPEEIAKESEARDVYYASLDEALEPRKQRGRDAALVGLRDFAEAGILESQRLAAARTLLSRVFGGHRIDSLDTLMLPELEPPQDPSSAELIVSQVPSPHALRLIAVEDPTSLDLRSYLERGLPRAVHQALEAGDPSAGRSLLLAHADLEKGIVYFRSSDFQNASRHMAELLDATKDQQESPLSQQQKGRARFIRALAVALSAGPKDAAELIAKGPRFADALGNMALLDALASGKGPYSGMAAFNAAYLRELVAPPQSPDYWRDLADRYGKAASKLSGERSEQAQAKRKEALDTAKAIESKNPT